MGSKIEWTDATWNPVTGCTKVSAGCRNCYAERMARRLAGRCGYPEGDGFAVTMHPDRLDEPLRWRKPRRVFICSMGDLFHQSVPWDFVADVWLTMAKAPQHTYQVLTKRPARMREWMLSEAHEAGPMPNVWLGISAENQQAADERIPVLLDTPAAVRWVSAEPLLGPLDLWSARFPAPGGGTQGAVSSWEGGLDWVVTGGESGPGARPCHPDWARGLRDQCAAAGVPFLFKQWGAWWPSAGEDRENPYAQQMTTIDKQAFYRVGKKAAGRLLDGELHDAYPEVRR